MPLRYLPTVITAVNNCSLLSSMPRTFSKKNRSSRTQINNRREMEFKTRRGDTNIKILRNRIHNDSTR